jgi:hypothetical protein
MEEAARTCPACASATPESASFCPTCGHRLADPLEAVPVAHVEPRLFGVVSPGAALALACLLLVGAVVAFVASAPIAGIVLLAGSVATFVVFYGAASRDPASPLVRTARSADHRVRGWTRVATSFAEAWSRAGRDVVRLRGELRALRREREAAQHALGEAAYREDYEAVAVRRGRMRELDQAIADREHARDEALAGARGRVDEERLHARPTEIVVPDESRDDAAAEER